MLGEAHEGDDLSAEPLSGGVYGRSFLIRAGGSRYVLRVRPPGVTALLDVATEARVTSAAAAAGIAPAVRAVDERAQALLTVYLEGSRPLDGRSVRTRENIPRLAALLKRLHALRVEAPVFVARAIAESYVQEAREASPAWAAELLELAARHEERHPPSALCHNDLIASNVLDDGALRLVDFEYAVRAAPLLDLASLAAMNDYDAAERDLLLRAYGEPGLPAYSRETLDEAVRMVRLMAFFWARRLAESADEPEPFARFAAATAARLNERSQ
jgi:thiamine kinase-like enzyme